MAYYYYKFFCNDALYNAFNINDNYVYYKKQEIYKNLPFAFSYEWYPQYFYQTTTNPENLYRTIANNFYKAIFNFFREQNVQPLNNDLEMLLNTFVSKNKLILTGTRDFYSDNIQKEEIWYYESFKGHYREKIVADYDKKYRNKLIGNIGEMYINNQLKYDAYYYKYLYDLNFVAKDLGNGFGYDIYFKHYMDNLFKEFLIEVKTTFNHDPKDKDDCFTITKNEYNTFLATLDNIYAEYRVYRVFKKDNEYIHHRFRPIDEKTLVEVNNNDFTYQFHHIDDKNNKVFVRK